MTDPCGRRLSLAEWQVLCLVREEPTYGLVLVGLLARDGRLGQVWSVPKAVVYRALQRLEQLGLIRTVGEQRTSQGPVRSLYEATPAGQTAAGAWLSTPVEHARDVRSELMVKLALLDRSGVDSRDLLQAQLARLLPVAAALDDRLRATSGFEHTLVLWRHEAMTATMRFLEGLTARHVGSGLSFFGGDDASCSLESRLELPDACAGQAAAAAYGDGGPDRGCARSAGAVGALGPEAASVPVVRTTWPGYDRVNVQVALDAWLAGPGHGQEVVGITGFHPGPGLADLVQNDQWRGVRMGSPATHLLPAGPGGATLACLQCALGLVPDGPRRLALLVQIPARTSAWRRPARTAAGAAGHRRDTAARPGAECVPRARDLLRQ